MTQVQFSFLYVMIVIALMFENICIGQPDSHTDRQTYIHTYRQTYIYVRTYVRMYVRYTSMYQGTCICHAMGRGGLVV